MSGQSADFMQHGHLTLPIVPPQIQGIAIGVSGANGNLALGLGHEMVSLLLYAVAGAQYARNTGPCCGWSSRGQNV